MLAELLRAQDALARLEAASEPVAPAVREGLLARLACREAVGWLAHHGSWVHPLDLALRQTGITGSYAAAELGIRLASVLPATSSVGEGGEPPEDRDVVTALRHAVMWRRLAELRSWVPDFLPPLPAEDGTPALVAAVQLIVAPGGPRLTAEAGLRAAWLWRERGGTGHPGLLLWSAPVQMLHRAALAAETAPAVLAAMAEAAIAGRRELVRLLEAERRGLALAVTARSHLPAALEFSLRHPVVTVRQLAEALGVSPRAGLDLLDRLVAGGVLREATGRKSWRGFVVI